MNAFYLHCIAFFNSYKNKTGYWDNEEVKRDYKNIMYLCKKAAKHGKYSIILKVSSKKIIELLIAKGFVVNYGYPTYTDIKNINHPFYYIEW